MKKKKSKQHRKVKQRNFVAKYMNSVNKNAKHVDKKKLSKQGKSKHKINHEEE